MSNNVREFVARAHINECVITGANTNTSIGTRNSRGKKLDDAAPDYCIGPYGNKWINPGAACSLTCSMTVT
jgi:hypothetical protein